MIIVALVGITYVIKVKFYRRQNTKRGSGNHMGVYKYRRDLYSENMQTFIYFETMCYIRRV